MKITTLLLIWALGIMPIFCYSKSVIKNDTIKTIPQNLELYNLYYISKYLGSSNLDTPQKKAIYAALISQIDKEKLATSSNLNIVNFITNYKESIESYKRRFYNFLSNGAFPDVIALQREINVNLTNLPILEEDYKELKNQKDRLNNLKTYEKKNILENLKNIRENCKTNDTKQIKVSVNNLTGGFSKEEFLNFINSNSIWANNASEKDSVNICSEINLTAVDNNLKAIDTEINKFNLLQEQYNKKALKAIETLDKNDFFSTNIENFVDEPQVKDQININSIVQNAQKDLSYSGLSLPSESQMIEAMAIFLANRAKQEAAIWFMDEIRSRMNNPLIYDAFPETIKLIDHLQDYQTPNFSSSWRYAISSDFVKMPRNIASSSWVKDAIIKDPTNASNLETGINFGYDINRLMAERYNYRDIIRHFYINPYQINASVDKTRSIVPVLNTSFVSLYIITNELFVIDNKDANKKYRLLSYEEVSSLSLEQWNVLIELMKLKYSEKFSNNEIWKKLKEKEIASKWIGNLLISLSQFDKINIEQQILREQNKLESTDQSFYSVWKILEQVINNINYEQFVNLNNQQKFQIELLKNSVSIYEDLQLKNFIAAAQKTLNLIDSYTYLKNSEKESSYIIINKNIKINREDPNNFDNFSINIVKTDKEAKKGTIVFDGKNIKIKDENNVILFEINEFNKISSFVNYLNNKNDTYNLAIEILSTKKDNLNSEIRNIARKLGINEAQFIQIINYAFLLNKEKDPKKIDLKNTLRSFASFTLENKDQLISKYNGKYTEQLYKLTSFLGDIMTAKDKNELANVIDSHALPPTSYKLKRRMAWSIDLNSFVGAYGGYIQPSTGSSLDAKWTGGIAATIGIAITESHKFLGLRNKGLVIDLVDLGNIVNHYLVSPNVDYDKDVHFSEVFSPGVSFIAAIGNTPLVFSAGVKFLPLKAVRLDNNEVINGRLFDATIFNIGLKIDIPLVNLYSKDFSK